MDFVGKMIYATTPIRVRSVVEWTDVNSVVELGG
jgi:hypothetical protein